jgi:hypothetical protein
MSTPTTGSAPPARSQMSRYINPYTKDYEYDLVSRGFRRMTGIRQRVQLALGTLRGSSTTLSKWGVTLPRKITPQFPAEAEAAVRQALSQMTDVEKVLKVNRVEVQTYHMRSKIVVWFTDLTTNMEAQETLNLV